MNPLYSRFRRPSQERGSVLVVCMVLAALGTLGVAAWMSLLDARGHQIEASFTAFERRVARENSRALAHRAVYANVLASNAPLAADTTVELPDNKGRAVIRAFATVPLKSNSLGAPSRNGGTPLTSHSTEVNVDVGLEADMARWTYRLRNYHPALAGDLLSLHAPVVPNDVAPLVSGNIRVKGRAVFWDAVERDLGNGLRADEFLLPESIAGATSFTTTDGAATLPLNYPHYLRTTGVASGASAYRGELEILSATVNPQNAYEERLSASAPLKLNGKAPKSESNGPTTKEAKDGDEDLITFIEANPPKTVADELSKQDALSSPVLVAAVQKANPAMTNRDFLQIFDAQLGVPDDALTEMMANLDEGDLDSTLDMAIVEMNVKNGTKFNGNGKGMVQLFLDQPELSQVVVEDVKRLRLFGQPDATKAAAAAALAPLLLIVDNRGGEVLGSIDLFHENRRPLIVVVASAPGTPGLPTTSFKGNSAFPTWRVVFDLQHTGLAFDLGGVAGAKLVGGIRANHRITAIGAPLTLERETDGAILLPLLSRDAWIECVRN